MNEELENIVNTVIKKGKKNFEYYEDLYSNFKWIFKNGKKELWLELNDYSTTGTTYRLILFYDGKIIGKVHIPENDEERIEEFIRNVDCLGVLE